MEINDVKYLGKYVALDANDNVIGVAESRGELVRSLEEEGYRLHEYTILYIPSPLKVRIEYSQVMGEKLPLINVKLTCKSSFRAIATFGLGNLIDRSLAELCGFDEEGKVTIEIGAIRKEIRVRAADLSEVDLPIVPGLILSPLVFNSVCFYDNYIELG